MPPAAHRLSLHLLPADPEAPVGAVRALFATLQAEGWLADERPGPRALVAGGFLRARLETFDTVRFVSNWQGGFHVRCPVDARDVVGGFGRALEAWRAGGPRALGCDCGAVHPLEALVYAPDAGFARGWITLADIADVRLDPVALARARAVVGEVRIVLRRG